MATLVQALLMIFQNISRSSIDSDGLAYLQLPQHLVFVLCMNAPTFDGLVAENNGQAEKWKRINKIDRFVSLFVIIAKICLKYTT